MFSFSDACGLRLSRTQSWSHTHSKHQYDIVFDSTHDGPTGCSSIKSLKCLTFGLKKGGPLTKQDKDKYLKVETTGEHEDITIYR